VVTAWRLVRPEFGHNAYNGRGARLYGGRWNSPGVPVAYASASLSLAALELLVHVPPSIVLPEYVSVSCEFPETLIEDLEPSRLPEDWRAYPAPPELAVIGDEWATSGSSAVLRVPSAVIPFEYNYLLNPEHPDFRSIHIARPRPFALDLRLRR
jgi:RES domain-containing protein